MTGRHRAPHTGAGWTLHGRGTRRRAPLGRRVLLGRSLVDQRSTALLLAVLTAVTTAFLLAVPRVQSVAYDRALGDAVRTATPTERDLGLRLRSPGGFASIASQEPTTGPVAPFASVDTAMRAAMGPRVLSLVSAAAFAAQSGSLTAQRATGDPFAVSSVRMIVRVDSTALEQVRWTAGAAPGAPTATRALRDATDRPHVVRVVPVALSARTAAAWGVGVGDVVDLSAPDTSELRTSPTSVVVTGLFEPLDPAGDEWASEPRMLGIAKLIGAQGGTTDEAVVLAPLSSYAVVGDGLWRGPSGAPPPSPSPALLHSWRYSLDADRLTREDVDVVRSLLVRLDTDPTVWSGVSDVPTVVTGLGNLVDRYERDLAVTGVMTSFVTGGVTALAVLVLALAALLGTQRRARELRLLRARGASRAQVTSLVGLTTSVLAVPAAAIAALAVTTLVAGGSTGAAWVEVALVLVLPPAVAMLATARGLRALDAAPSESTDLVRTARRVVLEVGLVVLAVLALTTVRSRGGEISAGRTDWYAAVTPVLVALAGGVVALRLMPFPVSWLARRAERGTGLVSFVGLTRAARAGAAAAVPLVALVVGVALVTLMATLTASITEQREIAARRAVGADARVDAPRVDAPDVVALAARPGVETAIPAHVDPGATLTTGGRVTSVVVVGVDPVRYAAMVRGTPLAYDVPPAALAATPDGRVPFVLSGGPPVGDVELRMRGLGTPARQVATVPALQRVVDGKARVVALVPLDVLTRALPTTRPNTVFLRASTGAQRSLDSVAPPDRSELAALATAVTTVDGFSTDVAARSLPRHVVATYLAGTLLSGGLSFLAVLLLLSATRSERSQLAIRLRTMGLAHGRERRLAWAEILPMLTVGVLAGAVVGVLVPPVLAGALDLSAFTGAVSALPIDARPLTGLLVALAALVVGSLALLTDAASARRGDLADHLRRGDTA